MAGVPRVLIIAGSDSSGGAGIQADIKTATALGCYAATAITAITVQDTTGVHAVHAIPPDIVAAQIRHVLADIGADAIKIGMLGSAAVAHAVADVLERHPGIPLVLDPVMVAKGGARLLADDAVAAIATRLMKRATLVTPNAPETTVLTGQTVDTPDDLVRTGQALLAAGGCAALVKGGHIEGATVTDALVSPRGIRVFSNARIDSRSTHGTGCTLSTAIACGLAQGMSLEEAVERARLFVLEAIRTAPGLGRGHGPLNHMHAIR